MAIALIAAAACEENAAPPKAPEPPPPPIASASPSAEAPLDPIGARPSLEGAKAYAPPTPEVFKAQNGMTIWLITKKALPLVAVTVGFPSGSASDPKDKPGLAYITADMLDEGAGSRNAVDLSTAVNDLGATLTTGASVDGMSVSLSVLKKNFGAAFGLMSDVIARPKLDAKEFKRASDLWRNDLKKRAQEPNLVARVAMGAAIFGPDSPYGHPVDGYAKSAASIDLKAVKGFYSTHVRPDRATMVVAGDITKDEVLAAVDASLGGFKAEGAPPPPPPAPVVLRSPRPKFVLVDREDAPQSVIAVAREGVAVSDPRAPLLALINVALGGSFTSRLNQNLREDHGWTYGAASAFAETRGTGHFWARAAVVTEATGQALAEMLKELGNMARAGLTPEELDKVRAQDRADLIETYVTVGGISRRLGGLALLGLPPDYDATASRARQAATGNKLLELASFVSPEGATVVVVGPRAAVEPQLTALKLGDPEVLDADGAPAKKK